MAFIIGTKGEHKGERFSLDPTEELAIGRGGNGTQLNFASRDISRRHATIFRDGTSYCIVDDGSHNGTRVNQRRIPIGKSVRLDNGARIGLCGNELQYWHDDPCEEIAPEEFSSTVELTLSARGDQSAKTLALLLALSENLNRAHNVQQLLKLALDGLFDLFEKTDRVLLFLNKENGGEGELHLTDVRCRNGTDRMGYSKTLLQECQQTGDGIVAENANKLGMELGAKSMVMSAFHTVMCAPLKTHNCHNLGVIQLDVQASNGKFNEDDLQLLMAVTRQIAMSLEQARDQERLLDYERVMRDLEIARYIQHNLLPQNPPKIRGYDFEAFYEPAREVGGDYYDIFPLPDGKFAILQGDVAGKGIAASLIMARISSAAAYALHSETNLPSVMAKLNNLAREVGGIGRFVTLITAILDPASHTVTVANAGHNRPLRYAHDSGQVEEIMPLEKVGLPLGVMEDGDYPEWAVTLNPAQALLLYSDGLIDSRDSQDRRFGIEGVMQAVTRPRLRVAELMDSLVHAAETHSEGCEQFDDTTIVCFGRTAAQSNK